jgi:hypothetical protein
MDLHAWIAHRVDLIEQLISEHEWPPSQAEGVRLRCEADRRILDRHQAVDDRYSVACNGCGYDGSYCPGPITENVNDCPELLDLGYAHGLTSEILAELDRPAPPVRTPAEQSPLGKVVSQVWGDTLLNGLRMQSVDVPAALRGPNWNADARCLTGRRAP